MQCSCGEEGQIVKGGRWCGLRIPWDTLGEMISPSWSVSERGGIASPGRKELACAISPACPSAYELRHLLRVANLDAGSLLCFTPCPCVLVRLPFWDKPASFPM